MTMWTYVIRRMLAFIPTMLVTVTVIFVLTRLAPGNPAWALIGDQSVSAEKIDQLIKELGLNRPIIVQYGEWLHKLVVGDLGSSFILKRPVATIMIERFPTTLYLAGLSIIATVAIGVPVGILAAVRRDSLADHLSLAFATLGLSVPSFWLGFVLITVLSVGLGWFPSSGYRDLHFGVGPWLSRLTLPVLALSLSQIGLVVRTTRSSILDVLGADYVRTARAKGLTEPRVIYKHALRNALIPIITVLGLIFALSLGGAVIIETVFAIPGVGRLITAAALWRDYPLIQGGILYLTLVALVINLLVDLLYVAINPQVTYG